MNGESPLWGGLTHRGVEGINHCSTVEQIKTFIIPKQNLKELEEIPEHVKNGITFIR
jgi:ATP-dependent Lon protease